MAVVRCVGNVHLLGVALAVIMSLTAGSELPRRDFEQILTKDSQGSGSEVCLLQTRMAKEAQEQLSFEVISRKTTSTLPAPWMPIKQIEKETAKEIEGHMDPPPPPVPPPYHITTVAGVPGQGPWLPLEWYNTTDLDKRKRFYVAALRDPNVALGTRGKYAIFFGSSLFWLGVVCAVKILTEILGTKAEEAATSAEEGRSEVAAVVVADSLGEARQASQAAALETAVVHRCYTYWVLGILIDKLYLCSFTGISYCAELAVVGIPPYVEVILRSVGNLQALFGFLMMSGFQDSRARPGVPPRLTLGVRDLILLGALVGMYWPLPHIMFSLLGTEFTPQKQDEYSAPRSFLLMMLLARLYVFTAQALRLPPAGRTLVMLVLCFRPSSFMESPTICDWDEPSTVRAAFNRALGYLDLCHMFFPRWQCFYMLMYVATFHHSRPLLSWTATNLPKGPVWGTVALASSMLLGTAMALWHYPSLSLEAADFAKIYAPYIGLEFLASAVQPALFALGMVYLPLNLSFWGSSALGVCLLYMYFLRYARFALEKLMAHVLWDTSGLLILTVVLGLPFILQSVLSVLGQLLYQLLRLRGAASAKTL